MVNSAGVGGDVQMPESCSELQSRAAALYSANGDKSMDIHYSVRKAPNKLHCIARSGVFNLCSRGRVLWSHLYCSSRSPGRVMINRSRLARHHGWQFVEEKQKSS